MRFSPKICYAYLYKTNIMSMCKCNYKFDYNYCRNIKFVSNCLNAFFVFKQHFVTFNRVLHCMRIALYQPSYMIIICQSSYEDAKPWELHYCSLPLQISLRFLKEKNSSLIIRILTSYFLTNFRKLKIRKCCTDY